MANVIKVGELKKNSKALEKEILVDLILFEDDKQVEKDLRIKTYLPLKEKIEMANKIFTATELNSVRSIIEDVIMRTEIVRQYTNINLPDNTNDAYDLIMESGIYNIVIDSMNELERKELFGLFDNYRSDRNKVENQEFELENGMAGVMLSLRSLLATVEEKLPDTETTRELVQTVGQEIATLDMDKIESIREIYKQDNNIE